MHILCARARVYYQIFINVNMHCTCNSRKKNISGGPWHMRSRTTAKLKASSFLTARALEYNEFSKLSCFVNKLSSRRRQCISVTSRFFFTTQKYFINETFSERARNMWKIYWWVCMQQNLLTIYTMFIYSYILIILLLFDYRICSCLNYVCVCYITHFNAHWVIYLSLYMLLMHGCSF